MKTTAPIYGSTPSEHIAARTTAQGAIVARTAIRCAGDIWTLLSHLHTAAQEHVVVVLLDSRHRVMQTVTAAIGQVDRVLVSQADIFRPALMTPGCASIILTHNHPSGPATPSAQDHELTSATVQAGRLLGITVLDHVIVGSEGYYSYGESSPTYLGL